jgi:hypothetical protein
LRDSNAIFTIPALGFEKHFQLDARAYNSHILIALVSSSASQQAKAAYNLFARLVLCTPSAEATAELLAAGSASGALFPVAIDFNRRIHEDFSGN